VVYSRLRRAGMRAVVFSMLYIKGVGEGWGMRVEGWFLSKRGPKTS